MKLHQKIIKRTIDIFASLIVLILLAPLFLIIAFLIKLDSKGPVIFRQLRVGKDRRLFTCYKFRTMHVNAPDIRNPDGSTYNDENDPRLTKVGRFLRKTSLDELPQFFNVLRGEMSVVGPRPELPDQIKFYNQNHMKRLLVKPGITGLAAIRGRNAISWKERLDFDVEYVEKFSLLLDFYIILKTIPVVLLGKGIYAKTKK